MDLSKFNTENLFNAATGLFEQLGIKLNSNTTSAMTLDSVLKENRGKAPILDSVKEVYFLGIVDNSVFKQSSMFESGYSLETGIDEADRNYDGLMIFAVDLDHRPTRTDLSALTRAFNRISKAMPVALLAKYDIDSEAVFSLTISERFKYSQTWREGEKVGKIILLKDINTAKTHAGHERILEDLKRTTDVTTYAQLHAKWLIVLDTKELNKTFFQELANWYFWAIETVEFPADDEANDEVRNATSVIRLITRLMFVWFLKEKGLVSEKLFDEKHLKAILNFKDDSSYYKAVLQNLFFATLNSDMGTRKFIAEPSGGRSNQHFVHNVFRYKHEFKKPDETIKELFEPIPFLNGGLFECLDKEVEAEGGKTVRVRVDSFSDHPKNVLFVPDELFFGAEDEIDLNEIYGTKNKRYKVRGLINILNRYKFTIAENTPLEEEIALDPELLGKVFENLLASYNPETKTTARKQTGSFYTPREIVNYMVDESLIAYLKQKLRTESEGFGYIAIGEDQATMFGNEGRIQQKLELPVTANRWQDKEDELEAALRALFSYSDEVNPFNETETEILIKAIDNCKILDPACGSGAFPMGILHRLVHLLGKLDPDNSKWKQWQKQKAIKETEKAFEIGDKKEREDRRIEINKIFADNSDDYGRKLFLIENCIYGVDIQPIAIQIAKLRFFISLIVDQKANNDARDNLGIRPLPNLETKFVAANTLIGLEAQGGLKPTKVNELEKQLKDVRARHFGARTRETKKKYREKDKEIRLEIADLLKQGGIKADIADQIAEWNPYDQNASASWFDAEYMFGIEKGFDIVIGNPPYFVYEGSQVGELEVLNKLSVYEPARVGKLNAYKLFLVKSHELGKSGSTIAEIFQNSFLADNSALGIRNYYFRNAQIVSIDSFPERDNPNKRVFPGVKMSVCILIASKNQKKDYEFVFHHWDDRERLNGFTTTFMKSEIEMFDKVKLVIPSLKENEKKIFSTFYQHSPIAKSFKCYQGELNMSSHREYFVSTANSFMALKGAQIQRYQLLTESMSQGEIEYVDVDRYLHDFDSPKSRHHKKERLVMQGITGVNERIRLKSTIVPENYFCAHSCNYFVCESSEDLRYLVGLLNSTFHNWIFKKTSTNSNVNSYEVEALTMPPSTEVQKVKVVEIVDEVIEAKKLNPDADTIQLEAKIDGLVYQLYGLTDEEIAIIEGSNV